jgi:hypothetical protein
MKKYIPHVLIFASLLVMVIEAILVEPFKYHFSRLLLIAAMLIPMYQRKKHETLN